MNPARLAKTLLWSARRRLLPAGRLGVCLLYHRVAEPSLDPWSLAVSPRHFEEHLDVLKRLGHPFRLGELLDAMRSGRIPRGSLVVTFDDGYADNLHAAVPLLEQHDVPATCFVTTGALTTGREFWWDELERILLSPGRLPATLDLPLPGGIQHLDLTGAAEYTEAAASTHRRWKAADRPPTARHRAYLDVWRTLRPLSDPDRRTALDTLADLARMTPTARPTHRPLSWPEVEGLAAHRLIDLGSHTATHPVLSALPPEGQRDEIAGGKHTLETAARRSLRAFAYPFGTRSDYTRETVSLVRGAGFEAACINVDGVVTPATDPYEVPRMYVQDWDGDTFARRLVDRLWSAF